MRGKGADVTVRCGHVTAYPMHMLLQVILLQASPLCCHPECFEPSIMNMQSLGHVSSIFEINSRLSPLGRSCMSFVEHMRMRKGATRNSRSNVMEALDDVGCEG